jgi:hypothetical protein
LRLGRTVITRLLRAIGIATSVLAGDRLAGIATTTTTTAA